MDDAMTQTGGANRLLQVLIIGSLGIHIILFLHLAGILDKGPLSYIELTMHETSKPDVRSIPRPRFRQPPPKVETVRKVTVTPHTVPRIKIEPVAPDMPANLTEAISAPELPDSIGTAGIRIPEFTMPVPRVETDTAYSFSTPREYFDMVQLRIEQFKEYPETAKAMHIEGRVKIRFSIDEQGQLLTVDIARKSRHRHLNQAAVEAIKKASPFPRPPAALFKRTPLTFNVTVTFELT